MELQNEVIELRYSIAIKMMLIVSSLIGCSTCVYYFLNDSILFSSLGAFMAVFVPVRNRKYFSNSVIITLDKTGIIYEEVIYPWLKIKNARINFIDGGEGADKNMLVLVQDDLVKEIRIDSLDMSPREISLNITKFAKQSQLSERVA